MAKGTLSKTVSIYVNGQQVDSTLKSLQSELRKLQNEQRLAIIGSETYVETSFFLHNSIIFPIFAHRKEDETMKWKEYRYRMHRGLYLGEGLDSYGDSKPSEPKTLLGIIMSIVIPLIGEILFFIYIWPF